ncbi:Alkaline phosphatase synthesis transcriptional regulatory protein PhoP [bacterium HR40]|jgi:DNA-binding response OmpR family regulator|nr:Alkaline phosphatase synthesis transcriptional regulatory protein PhoP [bacterium HR40]
MARILVIDDDDLLAELLTFTLGLHGHEVVAVADGESGLERAMREPCDLVVLDGILPGLDGLEVLRRLRGEPRTAELPVIMLSARRDERDVVGGLSLGAEDYLVKPFIPEELALRIDRTLRRTHLL